MKKLASFALFIFVSIFACSGCNAEPGTSTYPNDNSPLGTNLANVVDWSTEWVFVDTFKMSRDWVSQQAGRPWGQGGPIDADENGWVKSLRPGQSVDALMQWAGKWSGSAGKYVVLYDGEGILKFPGSTNVISYAPGRIVIDINPKTNEGGFILKIASTNPADYVRNIRVIRPGFESSYKNNPFHPLFLARIKKFKVLRFMDWQKTNNSPVVSWGERTTPDTSNQTGKSGVALEYMIALANTLHADPWFNMPHKADDNYVRQFARMVKERLNPGLKVYIEYSNEVWNGQFDQSRYAAQQGLAAGLSSNRFEAQLRYQSQRSMEIFRIWEEIFGSTDRLVRVVASQAGNPWTSTTLLDWNNLKQKTDAVAIAPYFCGEAGVGDVTSTESMSVEQLLNHCAHEITTTTKDWVNAQQAVIAARGLSMIAYEGGQHLVGVGANQNNQKLEDLFMRTNHDPRMKDLYLDYLKLWKMAGGKMFVNYVSVMPDSKYGNFGVLEYQDQDISSAPKYQALMEYINTNATGSPH